MLNQLAYAYFLTERMFGKKDNLNLMGVNLSIIERIQWSELGGANR
ncbi:MAG: hypothetical protein RIQ62_1540 [Bacteroidota bacterium]